MVIIKCLLFVADFQSWLLVSFIFIPSTISFIPTHFVFLGICVVFISSRSDNVIKNNITSSRSEEEKYFLFVSLMKFFVWLVFIYLFMLYKLFIHFSHLSFCSVKNERVKFSISLFIFMSNILNGFFYNLAHLTLHKKM